MGEVDCAMSADRHIALLGNVTLATTITEDEAEKVAALLARHARDKAELLTWMLMFGLAA